jgi:hypothetical protein
MQASAILHRHARITMAETSAYYHVAYTLALGIYAAYALSLYIRRKRVRAGR